MRASEDLVEMKAVSLSAGSDMRLVRTALKDNRAAEHLLLRLMPRIRRAVYIISGGDAETEDLVSKTLLTVYENLSEYKGTGSLEAWAGKIAFNVALRHKQRRRMIDQLILPEMDNRGIETSTPEQETANRRFRERAESILTSLPENRRNALVLRLVLGHSVAEIAKMTGVPVNTVRGRLRTGLKELRRAMAQERDYIIAK